jgi:transposase
MLPTIENLLSERIDDIVLLLQMMIQIGLPELLNRHLPRHHLQTGLDLGWVAVIWLSYIVSQGDHRKVRVREWVEQRRYTLEQVCGFTIQTTDFTDDRLGIVLKWLAEDNIWTGIEREFSAQSIEVYDLPVETVRLDATTISGYRVTEETGLFQFGHSKDDPSLPQVKLMLSTLDPLGMPLVSQMVSGEQADDGLYVPVLQKVRQMLQKSGLLYVGDCKMSALATRAHLQGQADYYLCPLPLTGKTAADLDAWITTALSGQAPIELIERADAAGELEVIAEGYELTRPQGADHPTLSPWSERVFVVYSPAYQQRQAQGLDQRLQKAQAKILALTPPRGRGKRQITAAATLDAKIQAILQQHRVLGLLQVDYECQALPATSPKTTATVRYQITQVSPHGDAIAALQKRFGWKAYVTNAPPERLTLPQALLTYRDEWRVEQGFRRLKGVPLSISPLFVQRDDQVRGLMHLLTLALRLLTLVEFVVRRQLRATGQALTGLYPENPHKSTDTPTAERLLRAFANLTITIVQINGQRLIHAPPLSTLQAQIIALLGLPDNIYANLADNAK